MSPTKMKLCFQLSFGHVQIFIRTQKAFLTYLESKDGISLGAERKSVQFIEEYRSALFGELYHAFLY